MKNHLNSLEVFLRNSFSLVNLGAWEPKTDTIFINMNSIDEISQETGFTSEELRAFAFLHEQLNRNLQMTIPLITLMMINIENGIFVSHFDHVLKKFGRAGLKEELILNAIAIQRLFIESEPLIEAYYMSFMSMQKSEAPLFGYFKSNLFKAYPKAAYVYQRIQDIGNDFVIPVALNNPNLCHDMARLMNNTLLNRRFLKHQLADLWSEKERPYERCMRLIDAIEVTQKEKRIGSSRWDVKEKYEEICRAKWIADIQSATIDLSDLPRAIRPMISTKLYLNPRSSKEDVLRDAQSSFLIELRNDQLKLSGGEGKFEETYYEGALFTNLISTWAVQQVLAGKSEITCLFEAFNICTKRDCNTCRMGKFLRNGMKVAEIFCSTETEMDPYLELLNLSSERE
jgi:hypothetical protein